MAFHDETYIQSSDGAVITASPSGGARIISHHACQRPKTLVFCVDAGKAHHIAAMLGATVAPDSLMACGTAQRHPHFTLRSMSNTAAIEPVSK